MDTLNSLISLNSLSCTQRNNNKKTAELKCSAVCSNFVGETGLATAQSATASLNAFPVPLAAVALKTNLRKKIAAQPTFVFHTVALQVNLQQGIKKQKDVFRHLLAPIGFVGMTGFEGRGYAPTSRGQQKKAQAVSRAIEITLSPQPPIKECQPPHRKSR